MEHPGIPTILSTHIYLDDRTQSRDVEPFWQKKVGNSAEQVWQKLIKIPPLPPGFILEDPPPYVGSVLVESIVHIQVQTKGKKNTEEVDPQDWVDVHMMEIPGTTQRWVRPDLGARTQKPKAFDWSWLGGEAVSAAKGARTHLSLPADVDREELISAIQNQVLQPRPKFSIGDSLVAHRFSSLIGLAFLTAGLFSLGRYVRSALLCSKTNQNMFRIYLPSGVLSL